MDDAQDITAPARVLGDSGRRRRRSGNGRAAGGGGSLRNRAVGTYGERLAARRLEGLGLLVVDRNWRCEAGELDLVALETGGHEAPGGPAAGRGARCVVACEVKTRTSTRFGGAAQQVTAAKASRLRRLALRWVDEHPEVRTRRVRVDVIGVLVPESGAPVVEHLVGVSA